MEIDTLFNLLKLYFFNLLFKSNNYDFNKISI